MAVNTSGDLSMLSIGRAQEYRKRGLEYKPGTLIEASSEQDIRNWSKSDQRLYETLQKCREKFAERQITDRNGTNMLGPKRPSMECLPQRTLSKCPQFKVVSGGTDYTIKRKKCVITTPRSQSLLNLRNSTDKDDKIPGIVFKFPIQVTGLKPEKVEEQPQESNEEDLESQDYLSIQPAGPTPITIPTGMIASATSRKTESTVDQSNQNSPWYNPENLSPTRKHARKTIVRVATNSRDISPSVSNTAHLLLERQLSKVTYNFPVVANRQADTDSPMVTSARNASRQDSLGMARTPLSMTGNCVNSPRRVSLPSIPKYGSPYQWTSIGAVQYANTPDLPPDPDLRGSDVTSQLSSVKTPPTVSLPNTPDSERKFVQTGDGVFILNIMRSMTVSSLSGVSSSKIRMYRSRDKSNLTSPRV